MVTSEVRGRVLVTSLDDSPGRQLDGSTGKGRRREVDVTTESYEVARKYMVRLGPGDFADPDWVAALAKAGGFTVEAFSSHFARLRQN